jgi:hypothetical protein
MTNELKDTGPELVDDPWMHRSKEMRCFTCMWFVEKKDEQHERVGGGRVGRCCRHAPTMAGYPVVYSTDWCGDHKLDGSKVLPMMGRDII